MSKLFHIQQTVGAEENRLCLVEISELLSIENITLINKTNIMNTMKQVLFGILPIISMFCAVFLFFTGKFAGAICMTVITTLIVLLIIDYIRIQVQNELCKRKHDLE